jgi:two-component system, cell cycle sensor histidine kinase and response regulator CckA
VQHQNSSGRILLVDDEPALSRVMSQYLRRLGYDVVECGSGTEAWAVFEAEPESFDLVVSDMTLPDIPGPELLARMTSRNPALAVIAASGYPVDHAALPEGLLQEAAVLQKPFTPTMLAETVAQMLSSRQRGAGS